MEESVGDPHLDIVASLAEDSKMVENVFVFQMKKYVLHLVEDILAYVCKHSPPRISTSLKQMRPDASRCVQIRSDTPRYAQIRPDMPRYAQIRAQIRPDAKLNSLMVEKNKFGNIVCRNNMYAELNSEFVMRRANKVKGLGFRV